MSAQLPYLVTITGQDGPGIAERASSPSWTHTASDVSDVEQVRVHGRLLLCVEVMGVGRRDWARISAGRSPTNFRPVSVDVAIAPLLETDDRAEHDRFLVTVLAPEIAASTLEGVCARIAQCEGNIERIVRLAAYPVHSYEFAVAGGNLDLLRRALAEEAVRSRSRHRRPGRWPASSGQAPDRARCRLDPPPGRGDRPAGRAVRLWRPGGGHHRGGHGGRDRLRAGATPAGGVVGRTGRVGPRRRPPDRCSSHPAHARSSARSAGWVTRLRW